jgi:hypothetical protein
MSELTAHELLVRGRNQLASGGICSWRWTDENGGHCARGAIFAVAGELEHRRPRRLEVNVPNALAALGALINANEIDMPRPHEHNHYNENPFVNLGNAVAFWSNTLVDEGEPEAVIEGFDKAIAATAPKPDLSFLKDVRVEPERVA